MVDRRLILCFQGTPMCWALMAGEIRRRISEYPDDDVDLFQVWEVPSADQLNLAEDITKRFALEWGMEFKFGDGIEPHDYLAPFPAFVREHAKDALVKRWERDLAGRDQNYIPAPLRRTA